MFANSTQQMQILRGTLTLGLGLGFLCQPALSHAPEYHIREETSETSDSETANPPTQKLPSASPKVTPEKIEESDPESLDELPDSQTPASHFNPKLREINQSLTLGEPLLVLMLTSPLFLYGLKGRI